MAKAIEQLLATALLADAGVIALVAQRVDPVVVPQAAVGLSSTYPCLVYRRTGTSREQFLEGNAGIAVATVQMDCLATTYAGAKALAQAVRLALLTLAGAVDNQTIAGITLSDEEDTYYQDIVVDGKAGVYAVTMSYDITFTEQSA